MRNYYSTATITLLLTIVALISIAHAELPIKIAPTDSKIADSGGCAYWRPMTEEPKLVKKIYDNGEFCHIVYEHESGNPILLEGYDGNNPELVAALNLDGKEILLNSAKIESIQCSDQTYNKSVCCEKTEYTNRNIRVEIIQLSKQSMCFPLTSQCASISVSASITVSNETSKSSFVVVGYCGE